ncbi:MAG: nucleotidyl transferase AbiEii/AbiGii toxin family protein [Planctomycetota bacterium]
MNEWLFPLVRLVAPNLDDAGVPYAIVGGLAQSIRAQPRFTRDADFALAVTDDADAERAARHLLTAGLSIDVTLDRKDTGRLATIRLRAPDGYDHPRAAVERPYVDLLCCACGIEPEIIAAAERFELDPGLTLPVARVPHLMAMKLLSASKRRKQDYVDLDHLIAVATDDDLATVRDLLALIAQRGHAPDPPTPDLPARFADLLAEHGRTT